MFRQISYRIALQFTGFVFLLMIVTGATFFAAESVNRGRGMRMRLERQLRPLLERSDDFGAVPPLPPFQRDRLRIVDAQGRTLYAGSFFEDIPFDARAAGIVTNDGDAYNVLTTPVMRGGRLIGYVQVVDRSPPNDLAFRMFLYVLISAAISGLTFGVGLFFARRSLKPAERMMERLEQFTQDASHELRTPLTAVNTSLDLALMTDDNREYVQTAKRDLKDVSLLVERLLELAQLDKLALQTESVDLRALVGQMIETYRPFAAEREVRIESALAPVAVEGDPALLRQAIGNLLSNAIKFNKVGGRVVIRLTPASLAVEDTGRGIAPASIASVFDRFYQEDPSRTKPMQGVGLGLALVKRIVELHGWSVDVRSEPGAGATFVVHFASKKQPRTR